MPWMLDAGWVRKQTNVVWLDQHRIMGEEFNPSPPTTNVILLQLVRGQCDTRVARISWRMKKQLIIFSNTGLVISRHS